MWGDDTSRDQRLADSCSYRVRYAGTKYNGSTAYGDSFLTVALKWKARVGSADYT